MKMFDFKKRQQSPMQVTSERCITESEFDAAVDGLMAAWVKAVKAAQGDNLTEVSKAIAGRICVLEQLQSVLFGEEEIVC